ncbi:MAG: AAA family ATPase [Hamadaea sp.]|nr:AAA family ATPase [Hamadaea sp.]
MTHARSVVVNGDLGSGKSTVSRLLADRLGVRRVSIGDLYREMAQQRGMTALELNLHAELDDKVDHYVDQLQADIATSGETLIVDSRLAWHFFQTALKVHLITDPVVAAYRVLGRPADQVEGYDSMRDAQRRLAARSESERVRFIERYGADKTDLRNYDLVCDTTRATPDEVVATITDALAEPSPQLRLFVDPRRVHAGSDDGTAAVRVAYREGMFTTVSGSRTVRDAVRDGRTLLAAVLVD